MTTKEAKANAAVEGPDKKVLFQVLRPDRGPEACKGIYFLNTPILLSLIETEPNTFQILKDLCRFMMCFHLHLSCTEIVS